ncbi:hypothetical protein WOLCODRAFT_81801, partial [Wolfiporia cocos MD-104 SS10]
ITCDMIVLVITWCNTFKVWRHGKRNKLDTSLTQLLLVDGMSDCYVERQECCELMTQD